MNSILRAVNRRDWLKLAGVSLCSTALAGAAEADLRSQAKRNLKLAIQTGIYGQLPLAEAARRIAADGFRGVVLDQGFADVKYDSFAPDWDAVRKITEALNGHSLKIVSHFGYFNVVDPDLARRQRGERRLELLIQNWKRFDCPVISLETGTLNKDSEWADAPENTSEQAYLQVRSAFERLSAAAAKTGAILAIEPYWRNIIDSVSRTERLLREVNSPALKLVMDPCNYFRKEDLPRMQPMLKEIMTRLGSRIVIAHAKDVKAAAEGTDLPAAGRGALDYPLYLRLLAQLDREFYLVIEHLGLEDVPRVRDFVVSQIDRL